MTLWFNVARLTHSLAKTNPLQNELLQGEGGRDVSGWGMFFAFGNGQLSGLDCSSRPRYLLI